MKPPALDSTMYNLCLVDHVTPNWGRQRVTICQNVVYSRYKSYKQYLILNLFNNYVYVTVFNIILLKDAHFITLSDSQINNLTIGFSNQASLIVNFITKFLIYKDAS